MTEELIVKQAPKSLQNEVAMQIQKERQMEASLKIGANRLTNMRRTRGLGDTVKTTTQTIEKEVEHKEETPNLISQMFSQTGKGLMQRMASPIPVAVEKNKAFADSMKMGSTMAGSTMGQSKYRFNATHTSPFRETVARGMMTGVGLLGK